MEQNFDILPQKFLEPSKVKKYFSKIFLTLGGPKQFLGENSKFRFQLFVDNLVVCRMPKTACRYLENSRRRWIFRETGTAKKRNGDINR